MADLVFVLILLAFFGLAVLFVRACDLIIGRDEAPAPRSAAEPPGSPGSPGSEEVAA